MVNILRGSLIAVVFIVLAGGSRPLVGRTLPVKYQSPSDVARAVFWLGKLKSEAALPLLIRLCEDKDGAVRMAAVVALGEIGDPKAIAILAKLANDPAQAAVKGVVSFEQGRTRKSEGDPSASVYLVQQAAQEALLKLAPATPDPPQFISDAMAALQNLDRKSLDRHDRDSEGTQDAVTKYYHSPEYKADDAMYMRGYEAINLVDHQPGPTATKALATVLGCGSENLELLTAGKLAARDKADVLPLIHSILEKPGITPLTITACLTVLNTLDPAAARAAAQQLVARYEKADGHEWGRMPNIASSQLLASLAIGDMPILSRLLDSQSIPARRDTVTALIHRIQGGLPPLEELMDAENIPAEKLPEATAIFLHELNKPEADWATLKASYQLGRLKVKEAVPGLLREIEYPSWGSYVLYKNTASYYQPMAGWALTQIADPASIAPLRKIAMDEEKQFTGEKRVIRATAILAYARIAGKDAAGDLIAILGENDESISNASRRAGSDILLQQEDAVAFPSLSYVQEAAARGLAEIGGEDARKALVEYLNNARPLTRPIVKSIFRLDPDALDGWSQRALKSIVEDQYDAAVAIRFSLFPGTATNLLHDLLKEPGNSMAPDVIAFLQRKSLGDGNATKDLINALSAEGTGADACQRRLNLIEAIGCQGGPEVENALITFVESNSAKAP